MTRKAATQSSATDLRRQVLSVGERLSRQQRVVAEYLLANSQEVPFLSVPELAERTGTSEATVVRLCQRLGYSGYAEMKMALVDSVRADMQAASRAGREAPALDIAKDSLAAMARLEQLNIQRTLEQVDRETFRAVATLLFNADHVFTFGLGISAYLADFASYLLTEHGLRATCLATRFTSPREQLVFLRPTDVVLAFSFPPYSSQTLEVLEEARERGAPSVVVTDRATAPAASLASQTLLASNHGMTFTNATASVDVLLNALVVEIASHHQGEAVEAFAQINRILRDQAGIVDEG